MTSVEYRAILATIVRNTLRKEYPGLKLKEADNVCYSIARAIHARMYGANVDGVDSPIWSASDHVNDKRGKPIVDASELLKQEG